MTLTSVSKRLPCLLAALALALPAAAQPAPSRDDDRGPQPGPHEGPGPRPGFFGPPPGGPGFGHEGGGFGLPLRGIELTEAQRDKIFEIRHALAPAQRERMKTLAHAQQELRALTLAPKFDEAKARTLADTAAKAQAEFALNEAIATAKIAQLLTPEQRKQLDAPREGPRPPEGAAGGPAQPAPPRSKQK